MKTYTEIAALFEIANARMLKRDKGLFDNQVSERTLCGALMLQLHEIISVDENFAGYYVDVEYNRNKGGIKTIHKTIIGEQEQVIPINCDLIIHSRGNRVKQDNLLAIEMKKATRSSSEKNKDKDRLIALTKDSFDDVWAFDGRNLPEHVCRYVLGVYYEINYRKNLISIEYYHKGHLINLYSLSIIGNR